MQALSRYKYILPVFMIALSGCSSQKTAPVTASAPPPPLYPVQVMQG